MSMPIIVTRHLGAVEFLRSEVPDLTDAPVMASVNAEDVAGQRVFGNLPMHLAALAAEVNVVEFSGDAPRGTEYTAEQMRSAGARIVRYRVEVL